MSTKTILADLRDELLEYKEGSNAVKLAYTLGYFEAILISLARDSTRNQYIISAMINERRKYINDKSHS